MGGGVDVPALGGKQMTKNIFDLVTAIVTGIEVIADGIFVFLGATGKIDAKLATAIGGSVTVVGNAALAVCARFIKETEKKE